MYVIETRKLTSFRLITDRNLLQELNKQKKFEFLSASLISLHFRPQNCVSLSVAFSVVVSSRSRFCSRCSGRAPYCLSQCLNKTTVYCLEEIYYSTKHSRKEY